MFFKDGFAILFVAIAAASLFSGIAQAVVCQGSVTTFSGRQTIRDDLGMSGALLRDHLPASADTAEKVWYLPTYTGNTIEEYRTMDDFAAGNVLTTYRLPGSAGGGGMAWWGQGHVVYNNSLYYQRFPDCLSFGYDCGNEKAVLVRYDFHLQAFTALQSLPTAQLSHWAAGPSYVYLAVDSGSVWAVGLNKDRVFYLTRLNTHDLSVEETIDTGYVEPSSNMPPFIACGKFYSMVVAGAQYAGPIGAQANLIFDLTTRQEDTSTQPLYCLPFASRRYFSFNSRESKVYTVESNALVSYDVTIGGPLVVDPALLNCSTV